MSAHESSSFDIVVVGAGPAGYVAALRAGTWGARVALVEERELGGTCLNRGCIPTKALVESAATFQRMAQAHAFGLAGPGEARATEPRRAQDLAGPIAKKDEIVAGLRKGVEELLKRRRVELVRGRAALADARTVVVEAAGTRRVLHAAHVLLATGSRPAWPPFLRPDGSRVFTSDDILSAREIGPRVAIVGGGILGCEFAYILGALGYEVTVLEMLERVAPVFSPDASAEIERGLRKLGVEVKTRSRIEGCESCGSSRLALAGGGYVEADTILVAVGRRPCTEGLGLEALGVLDEKGFVKTDAVGRTPAQGLYAAGDVTGRTLLAHAASRQGLAAVSDALGKPLPHEGAIPWCAYTHPEAARVGMLEEEAARAGRETLVGRFPMQALGRARAGRAAAGYVKLVADRSTRRILGAEIVGEHATELIHEAALAVRLEATLEDLEEMVHAHPTLSEGLMEAASAALGRAIHI